MCGGSAGLITAISLAEWSVESDLNHVISITVRDMRYEKVLVKDRDWELVGGRVQYSGSRTAQPRVPARRGQVVTLQCDCLESLSKRTKSELFRNVKEAVLSSTSRNIPISEVEDRFAGSQAEEFRHIIHLQAIDADPDPAELLQNFDIIMGADGAGSWVRRNIMRIQENRMVVEGNDEALGISFRYLKGFMNTGFHLYTGSIQFSHFHSVGSC